MTKNEIKKELYRQKPTASIHYVSCGIIYYTALLGSKEIKFSVPVIEIGETPFYSEMEAKHLIRWLENVDELLN